MVELKGAFLERAGEIEAYLQLLDAVEAEVQSGTPRFQSTGAAITAQQQHILYSSVFVQLYNLVESTVVSCLDAVTESALRSETWGPADLNERLRREWVRVMARTHVDLTYENRLESALALCDYFIDSLPVTAFKMDKGGGGSWDDFAIEDVAKRLGFTVSVDRSIYSAVKRKIKDDLGPLGLVKKQRNSLAHGSLSFTECGQEQTVAELRAIAKVVIDYLDGAIGCFEAFLNSYEYLVPAKRPMDAA